MDGAGAVECRVERGLGRLDFPDDDIEPGGVDIEGRVEVGDDEAFFDLGAGVVVDGSGRGWWSDGDDVDVGEAAVSGWSTDVEFLFGDEEVTVEPEVADRKVEGGISAHGVRPQRAGSYGHRRS